MNKTIRSGTRDVIYKVFIRCLAEFQAGKLLSDLDDVYKRTADMTGKSESTVRRIANEGNINKGKFRTPAKHRKGRPQLQLDDFDICAIRQKIHFFYTVKKEVPTLKKLLIVLRKDIGYKGSREHLRKLLLSIGFRFKNGQSKRSALIEQTVIADKRERYLHIILSNRNLPEELRKPIIYLDESYIHSSWIVHAGSEKGFVPNALVIFSGQNKKKDYHLEMNQHNFKKWVLDKLVPNLTEPSIIVMDNAPYHSVITNKAPTSASTIADIRDWLQENGIPFDPYLRKPSLLMLVNKNKPHPIYEIDEILGEFGHEVIRLPPNHCDLNPIELIWALAKKKVAKNVGASDIKKLIEDAFNKITEENWRHCCEHVEKIERDYSENGKTLYENIESLVIQTGSDSESSQSESEEEVNISEQIDEQTYEESIRMEEEEHLDLDLLD